MSRLSKQQYLIISHNYILLPALLDSFSAQQWPKNRIQRFFQVLNQNYITCCQCSLYGIQVPSKKDQNPSVKSLTQDYVSTFLRSLFTLSVQFE